MSTIKVKRSASTGSPSALGQGEIAYSYLSGTQSNGGDRFYIGTGTESGGAAANIEVIGGKYFTGMLDHVTGTLTASSALLVDANSKIDTINVDNLKMDGNTISSTDSNGNIVLDPNGSGVVSVGSNLTVSGDLAVSGTTTTVNSTTVDIADPQLELATNNNNDGSNGITVDAVDIGTYGTYNTDPSGTNVTGYSGFFRDASDSGKIKFYEGLTVKPTSTVNNSHSSYAQATIVANFEGSFSGTVSGNAATATKLASARAIALSGDVSGTANFDGSAGINISTTIAANSVALGTDTTGNYAAAVAVGSGTGLSLSGSAGEGATFTVSGTDATTSAKGVASFSSNYFTVTSGSVSINDASTSAKGAASFASANFAVSSGAVSISAIDGGTYS